MQIFELLRRHLATSGIIISQKLPMNYPINARNSTVFILVCVTVAITALSLNDAKSFSESSGILFRSVAIGVCNILYAIIVWKTSKLLEFINGLDDTITESELKT